LQFDVVSEVTMGVFGGGDSSPPPPIIPQIFKKGTKEKRGQLIMRPA